jgi:hypothetical protein
MTYRRSVVSAAAAVFAVILISQTAGTASAGVLGPKKPSELVTAKTSGAAGCNGAINVHFVDTQVTPDGSTLPLAIPPGQVFIVTKVTVRITNAAPASVQAGVVVGDAASGVVVDQRSAPVDASNAASFDFEYPNGLAVRPGKSLCILRTGALLLGTAHGYLTKDR